MKHLSLYILFPVIIFSLFSCGFPIYMENTAMSSATIDVLKPAVYDTIPQCHQLLVLPGHHFQTEVTVDGQMDSTYYRYGQEILNQITDAFLDRFSDSYTLSASPYSKANVPQISERVDWSVLDTLAQQENCDGILLIDQCKSTLDVGIEQGYPLLEYFFNQSYFIARAQVLLSFSWTYFDPVQHTKIHHDTVCKNRVMGEWKFSPDEALDALQSPEDIFSDATQKAGESAASSLSPLWEPAIRYYYSAGSPEMKAASDSVANGKWDAADSIWENLLISSRKGISLHASYNLILIHEVRGELEEGLALAQKLWREDGMEEAKAYAELLENRIRERQRIEKQVAFTQDKLP